VSPRYVGLSLVALCIIFLLILKNYETWTRSVEITPERSTVRKQETKIVNPPTAPPQKVDGMTQHDPATMAAKNIFSPDRKDFPVLSSETKPIVRPQVVLYGVTIGDGYQFASIVNPGRRLLRGERETMSVKVGDKVGDYKLARISSDRIILEAEGDSFEVLLYDPKSPKRRMDVKTEAKPATITSTQASPQAGAVTPPAPPRPAPTQQVAPASPPVAAPQPQLPAYDYRRSRRPFAVPTTPPATGQTQGTGAQGTGGN